MEIIIQEDFRKSDYNFDIASMVRNIYRQNLQKLNKTVYLKLIEPK